MKKTILISFYGAVVSDDNTTIPDFYRVANKLKNAGHSIRVFSESPVPILDEWCMKNGFLPFDDESYDLLISPIALGAPITEDGNLDWNVAELILENAGYLPDNKQDSFSHIAPSKMKFDPNN